MRNDLQQYIKTVYKHLENQLEQRPGETLLEHHTANHFPAFQKTTVRLKLKISPFIFRQKKTLKTFQGTLPQAQSVRMISCTNLSHSMKQTVPSAEKQQYQYQMYCKSYTGINICMHRMENIISLQMNRGDPYLKITQSVDLIVHDSQLDSFYNVSQANKDIKHGGQIGANRTDIVQNYHTLFYVDLQVLLLTNPNRNTIHATSESFKHWPTMLFFNNVLGCCSVQGNKETSSNYQNLSTQKQKMHKISALNV